MGECSSATSEGAVPRGCNSEGLGLGRRGGGGGWGFRAWDLNLLGLKVWAEGPEVKHSKAHVMCSYSFRVAGLSG